MNKEMNENLFNGMQIVQYEDIPCVQDLECPDCHKSDVGALHHEQAEPIGWCDTPSGLMGVFECPKCFTKFRCHICGKGRWNKDEFYIDFALLYCLYNKI